MMDRRLNLLAAVLLITTSGLLIWYGLPGWALLVAYLGYLGVALYVRYRRNTSGLAKLKAERAPETFEAFWERLNRPDYDRALVRTVYTAISSMAGDVALRPYDDLVRDLKIDPDDLGEALFSGLKGPLRLIDSAEALAANVHRHRRQTLGGLIDFYANHPKQRGQALPSNVASAVLSSVPSTPSARST
jgi:hypothetical protein